MYNIISKNYKRGLWNESMVRMAVRKGVITQQECDEILGITDQNSSADTD